MAQHRGGTLARTLIAIVIVGVLAMAVWAWLTRTQ
jgi:hypothetical protein